MPDASGMTTPLSATPSGMKSTTSGMTTPDQLQLRKRAEIEAAMEQKEHKDLFKIIPERSHGVGAKTVMGNQHTYDMGDVKKFAKQTTGK